MLGVRLAVVVGSIAVGMLVMAPAMACTTPNWVTPAGDPATEPPEPGSDFPIDAGGYEPGTVDLRLDGLEGESLGTAEAGEDGRFSTTVELPADLEAGAHQIVATQIAADGSRLWGFAPITVAEAAGGVTVGVLTAGGAALVLLLAGATVLVRHRRSGQREAELELTEVELIEDELVAMLEDEVPVP